MRVASDYILLTRGITASLPLSLGIQWNQKKKEDAFVAAMGQGQGGDGNGAGGVPPNHVELSNIRGFQLVRLLPHSPAHNCGLVSYFDIITALDHMILSEQETHPFSFFRSYIAGHRDTPVCVTVYSLRLRSYRDVSLTPSSAWGGGGLLGCSIEWVEAANAVQKCWHIVEILERSPAAFCPDLHEGRDYILGMQQPDEQLISLLQSQDDFHARLYMWQDLQRSAIEQHMRYPSENIEIPHTLLLLIYDVEENRVKEILVDMGKEPGTPLGIVVATGLLHLIPAATEEDTAGLPVMDRFFLPRELDFTTDYPHPPSAAVSAVAAASATVAPCPSVSSLPTGGPSILPPIAASMPLAAAPPSAPPPLPPQHPTASAVNPFGPPQSQETASPPPTVHAAALAQHQPPPPPPSVPPPHGLPMFAQPCAALQPPPQLATKSTPAVSPPLPPSAPEHAAPHTLLPPPQYAAPPQPQPLTSQVPAPTPFEFPPVPPPLQFPLFTGFTEKR